MSVAATTPFEGASSKGVEFLKTWIARCRSRTDALLTQTALKYDEVLSDVLTSSTEAYGKQWAHFSSLRAVGVTRARETVIYAGGCIALVFSFLLLVFWLSPNELGERASENVRFASGISIALVLVGGGAVWAVLLGKYVRSCGLGFADLFADRNPLALKAWGISEAAVYIIESDGDPGNTSVRRIANSEIGQFEQDDTCMGVRTTIFELDGTRHDLYQPIGRDHSAIGDLRGVLHLGKAHA